MNRLTLSLVFSWLHTRLRRSLNDVEQLAQMPSHFWAHPSRPWLSYSEIKRLPKPIQGPPQFTWKVGGARSSVCSAAIQHRLFFISTGLCKSRIELLSTASRGSSACNEFLLNRYWLNSAEPTATARYLAHSRTVGDQRSLLRLAIRTCIISLHYSMSSDASKLRSFTKRVR